MARRSAAGMAACASDWPGGYRARGDGAQSVWSAGQPFRLAADARIVGRHRRNTFLATPRPARSCPAAVRCRHAVLVTMDRLANAAVQLQLAELRQRRLRQLLLRRGTIQRFQLLAR